MSRKNFGLSTCKTLQPNLLDHLSCRAEDSLQKFFLRQKAALHTSKTLINVTAAKPIAAVPTTDFPPEARPLTGTYLLAAA